jgi:hypothetical protein
VRGESAGGDKKAPGLPKKKILIKSSDKEEDNVSKNLELEPYRPPVTRGRRAVLSHVEI